jgi:hypothetical protein
MFFIYQEKMLKEPLKIVLKSDSSGPAYSCCFFAGGQMKLVSAPSLKSKNYSIAQNIIACARLG